MGRQQVYKTIIPYLCETVYTYERISPNSLIITALRTGQTPGIVVIGKLIFSISSLILV